MASIADQLMERRAALINEAQEVAQRGVTDGRDLTVEEQARFDQMIAEAEGLLTRAQAIHEGEERAHEMESYSVVSPARSRRRTASRSRVSASGHVRRAPGTRSPSISSRMR